MLKNVKNFSKKKYFWPLIIFNNLKNLKNEQIQNSKQFQIIYLLITVASFISCDSSTESVNKEFKFFYETKHYITNPNNRDANVEQKEVTTKISSTVQLDLDLDMQSFTDFIEQTKPDIKIETLIDEISFISIEIENGETLSFGTYPNSGLCPECNHDSNGNIVDSMACTQQGIKHCAFATYQTWSTPKIIAMSITGGAQAVLADCFNRNCFGW